jgi:hypothetical protein
MHACRCSWSETPHKTFGECIRSKGLRIAYCRSATDPGNDFSASKRWNKELDSYSNARREGIQPDSTKTYDIRRAVEFSDKTGVAYGNWES